MRVGKAGVAFINGQILSGLQPLLQALTALTDHGVFTHFDFVHVNGNRAANRHAIIAGPACDMSCARTGHECLRWDAAVIDTGAAEPLALNNRHLHSCVCQPGCKRRSCLPSANNDRIIFSRHRDTSARVTVVYSFQGSYQPLRTTCTLRPRKFAQLALIGARDRETAERPTPNVEVNSMHRKRLMMTETNHESLKNARQFTRSLIEPLRANCAVYLAHSVLCGHESRKRDSGV